MARIRTIKPEFWDSPGTARASLRARLFFIALWNWADDYGVGTANPGQLISFAFPNDDIETRTEFPRLRTEVAECFDVQWYEVESRPFYYIPSWDSHQKNERRAKGKFPRPDQAIPGGAEMRGSSVQEDGSSGIGTGEQGNRGTGEEGGADAPLSPFCKRHPNGTDDPCRPCATARTRYELAAKAEKNKPTPTPKRAPECQHHPGYPLPCDRCARDAKENM